MTEKIRGMAGGPAACRVCGESLSGADAVVRCAACETPHHEDCWLFNGRCAVYGCGAARCHSEAPVSGRRQEVLFLDDEPIAAGAFYRVSGGLSGTDVAHLGIVAFPLLWLPVAIEGGWVLAANVFIVAFPLLMFVFQVRTVAVTDDGLELGYLCWRRQVYWREIMGLWADPWRGYTLRLEDGVELAIPAEPGELRDLEIAVDSRLRDEVRRGLRRRLHG